MNCEYCKWIDKVLVEYEKKLPRKNNNKKIYQRTRILEPIIIVHGLPDEYLNENIKTSVEFIKKIIIDKYNNLLEGKTAIDTVESMIWEIEKLSDLSKELWRETILVDDKENIGCVAGLIINHSVKFAKDIYNRKIDVLQIINNNENENINDKINDNNFNIKSGCWSVIVRDLEENMSCGRTNWKENENIDLKISLNPSTIIYGCGIYLEDETCCSVSGNDEVIYLFSLAKKINKSIENTHKYTSTNQTINKFTNKFNNLSCIYLGPCERPIINCHSQIFPWFYCCKKKMYSGIKKDEFKMESI